MMSEEIKAAPLQKNKEALDRGLTEEEISKAHKADESTEKGDGFDKLLKQFGFGKEHKTMVLGALGLLVVVAVFLVFSSKKVGLEEQADSVTYLKQEEGRVAVLDPDLLVRAVVGQALLGKGADIAPEDLGEEIRRVVDEHEKRGIVVVDSKIVFSKTGYLDLTEVIAKRLKIDLKNADVAQRAFTPAPPIEGLETEEDIWAGVEE